MAPSAVLAFALISDSISLSAALWSALDRIGVMFMLSCLRDSPRVYGLNLRSSLLLRLPQVIRDLHP
jgi:hypothetical protein